MIESVQIQEIVAHVAQEAEGSEVAPKAASVPEDQDVQRFEKALDGTSEAGESPLAPPPSSQADRLSPGERILQSLDTQRQELVQNMQEVESTLAYAAAGKEVSPVELIQLQWKVQQAALGLEVTTKVVEKGNEGVSTLLKNQG